MAAGRIKIVAEWSNCPRAILRTCSNSVFTSTLLLSVCIQTPRDYSEAMNLTTRALNLWNSGGCLIKSGLGLLLRMGTYGSEMLCVRCSRCEPICNVHVTLRAYILLIPDYLIQKNGISAYPNRFVLSVGDMLDRYREVTPPFSFFMLVSRFLNYPIEISNVQLVMHRSEPPRRLSKNEESRTACR
jgi:hypothetical protein